MAANEIIWFGDSLVHLYHTIPEIFIQYTKSGPSLQFLFYDTIHFDSFRPKIKRKDKNKFLQ